jgi:UPF0716 protein FxsA
MLLFIGLPLLELALLIKLGQNLGVWRTLAVVIGSAILGLWVLRSQGMASLDRLRQAAEAGVAPEGPMADGLLRALAGVLLLLPGPIADALGLVLLVPPLRRLLGGWLAARAASHVSIDIRSAQGTFRTEPDRRPARTPADPSVIDGEFERLDERPLPPHRNDGPQKG